MFAFLSCIKSGALVTACLFVLMISFCFQVVFDSIRAATALFLNFANFAVAPLWTACSSRVVEVVRERLFGISPEWERASIAGARDFLDYLLGPVAILKVIWRNAFWS